MEFKYEFTRLLVSDFKPCFLFYRDVMGFKPSYGTENDAYADFALGSVTLALFDKGAMSQALGTAHLPARAQVQDTVCVVFAVESVDAAAQELTARGVTLETQAADRPDWGIRTVHFRDPAGNLIELYQPLAA